MSDNTSPARTLAADEVAVSRADAVDTFNALNALEDTMADVEGRRLREVFDAALDAAPAEPTAEDETIDLHAVRVSGDTDTDEHTGYAELVPDTEYRDLNGRRVRLLVGGREHATGIVTGIIRQGGASADKPLKGVRFAYDASPREASTPESVTQQPDESREEWIERTFRTEPARPSLPEFDADGRRIRCAKCDAPYDESRDAWGVCGKAECWAGSLDHAEPARPSLPDTPWTTVRVTLRDLYSFPHSKNKPPTFVWRTDDTPHAWFWDEDPNNAVSTGDVARVTSFTKLAEPPKGYALLDENALDDAYDKGWRDRGSEGGTSYAGQPAEQAGPSEATDGQADNQASPDRLGDTFSRETIAAGIVKATREAEDRAVERANDYAFTETDRAYVAAIEYTDRQVSEAEDRAVERSVRHANLATSRDAQQYTDRKVAEAVAQIVAAFREQGNRLHVTAGPVLLAVADTLADGENGGAER